jgi:hypothetical protein
VCHDGRTLLPSSSASGLQKGHVRCAPFAGITPLCVYLIVLSYSVEAEIKADYERTWHQLPINH